MVVILCDRFDSTLSNILYMSNIQIFRGLEEILCLFNHGRLLNSKMNGAASTLHLSTASNYWHQFTCGTQARFAIHCIVAIVLFLCAAVCLCFKWKMFDLCGMTLHYARHLNDDILHTYMRTVSIIQISNKKLFSAKLTNSSNLEYLLDYMCPLAKIFIESSIM